MVYHKNKDENRKKWKNLASLIRKMNFNCLFKLSLRHKIKNKMIKTLLFGIAILFIAILLMGVRVFFTRKGEFPNTHIGGSKAMKDRGISCATSQDREASSRESLIERIAKETI